MKRYLAFYGQEFYPSGGWNDYEGDYDTKEAAVSAMEQLAEVNRIRIDDKSLWYGQWAHIIDRDTKAEVWAA